MKNFKKTTKDYFIYFILEYFRFLAKLQLLKIRPTIIGITGSAGKTSTMEAVASVLKDGKSIKVSRKANSQSGISLDILSIKPRDFSPADWLRMSLLAPYKVLTHWEKFKIYVAEMGIDGATKPANMEYLLSIIRPNIGIYTSQSTVHAQAFDEVIDGWLKDKNAISAEVLEVAKKAFDIKKLGSDELRKLSRSDLARLAIGLEKSKLLMSLKDYELAVFDGDDELVRELGARARAKKLTFGGNADNDVIVKFIEWQARATVFQVEINSKSSLITQAINTQSSVLTINNYWLPKHFAKTFGAAVAVGQALGLDLATCCKRIENHFTLPPGRAALISGLRNSLIIDSSYNASTQSMLDMLNMIQEIKNSKNGKSINRIIGLLGDMREIGKSSQAEHQKIAQLATQVLDQAVLVGPIMSQTVAPILQKHHISTQTFLSSSQAGDYLAQILQSQDLILVKGSQNTIFLENAIKKIMQDPTQAPTLLCRQEHYWNKLNPEKK